MELHKSCCYKIQQQTLDSTTHKKHLSASKAIKQHNTSEHIKKEREQYSFLQKIQRE